MVGNDGLYDYHYLFHMEDEVYSKSAIAFNCLSNRWDTCFYEAAIIRDTVT